MDIELIVLGSGQDGGSPQFGSARGAAGNRLASSIVLIVGGRSLLFDASPDLRMQWQLLAAHRGGGANLLPDAVFVTHAHMGHYGGLLHFGPEAAATDGIPLHGPSTVLEFFRRNEPWSGLLRDGHLVASPIDHVTPTYGPVGVVGIDVPHRHDHADTVAYSIVIDSQPWALYLPDIDSWDEWVDAEATIAAHPVSLLDATFGGPDELPHRDVSAIPHPFVTDTVERFAHLTADHSIVLTHINHSNTLGAPDSDLRTRAERLGYTVAEDGMVIRR